MLVFVMVNFGFVMMWFRLLMGRGFGKLWFGVVILYCCLNSWMLFVLLCYLFRLLIRMVGR